MKKIGKTEKKMVEIEVPVITEEEGGLVLLLGKKVLLICDSYFYYGQLTGVNDTNVELSNPSIVYETGEWSSKNWKDSQKLPSSKLNVSISKIESWLEVNK